MSGRDPIQGDAEPEALAVDGAELLRPLVEAPVMSATGLSRVTGVVIGELIAMRDEGRTPLILYPGQPGTGALAARSVVDLHGVHIGKPVALMFERGDPARPIVMGVLREGEGWPLEEPPGQVQVDADGKHLVVDAKEEITLRCGKASVTLTKAGKVMIQGTYVLHRSSGVMRIKGGSVQLN